MLSEACAKVTPAWAHQHITPRLLDYLATTATTIQSCGNLARCLVSLLDPPPGSVVHDLRSPVVDQLRRLAFEPQFDATWEWLEQQQLHGRHSSCLATREALQQFLEAPPPGNQTPNETVPDFGGIEDEDWWNLDPDLGIKPMKWIRRLASCSLMTQRNTLQKMQETVLTTTNRSRAFLATVKWLLYLLDFSSVPNRQAIVEALMDLVLPDGHSPTHAQLVGVPVNDPHTAEIFVRVVSQLLDSFPAGGSDLQSGASESRLSYMAEVWRGDSDHEALKSRIISCLVGHPWWWRSRAFLVALFHDVTQPASIRAEALTALSFVASVEWQDHDDDDNDGDPSQDENAGFTEETARVVALLTSLLPPPPGEAVSLKDAAARCLAARLAQCQEEKDPSAADELARLPEELRLLVQNKSIRHFQWVAARGICRLIWRARGLAGVDWEVTYALSDPLVVAEKSKPSRLELELDLARWLPCVKSVLSAALIDPQAFALPGVDASGSRIAENIDFKYFTQLSLFGNDARSELKRRLFNQLQSQDVTAEKVSVLLYLCSIDDLQHPVSFDEINTYYASSWSEDMQKTLQALVSWEKVWSQMMADESVNSPMVVIQSCLRVHTDQPLLWISREGLQRAVASLQPAAP
ncbi:uncharacterized protein ACA1_010160 [Acanthamoeba castellanii str. Neff]|uniref:Uncharacterized protein n=1 Tax=Acanthamoeba castellanii (strain ATCC 30010 / Neff) TaxID=1257118 RepID=L8HE33_ACACF|nr:uncharacterized protein ACA1_010160 [Acanthamoeba castellanii str. Neff]ELR22626.1 hypothetical protein ACA1_010160 [Acanthamoeba castellanii str. Neff]